MEIKENRVAGSMYRGHRYDLNLEYSVRIGANGSRTLSLGHMTLWVDGQLISFEDPLFVEVEGDPFQTTTNYIDRLVDDEGLAPLPKLPKPNI